MIYTSAFLALYIAVLAGLFVFRRKLGTFVSTACFTIATLAWMRFGFDPAVPRSILIMFGGTTIVAVLLYITSGEASKQAFWQPVRGVMVRRNRRPVLYALLVLLPALVAWQAYAATAPSATAPPLIRSVHPSPPKSIMVAGHGESKPQVVDLISTDNPNRALETSDPEAFQKNVARGKVVYYENCFFCHGDKLIADGHFATAMKPPPAKFNAEVLPMFQENYFLWRISKGGPGLPDEGTPWDSTMPAWEKYLSVDDMWAVTTFLYEHTGLRPRTMEGGH